MSKFKIISNKAPLEKTVRSNLIETLIKDVEDCNSLSNKDLIVLAYKFIIEFKHPVMAQKLLNRITEGYFTKSIYEDLYKSMLAWSITQATPYFNNAKLAQIYEFFYIVKNSLDEFKKLEFEVKDEFLVFEKKFLEYNLFLTQPLV